MDAERAADARGRDELLHELGLLLLELRELVGNDEQVRQGLAEHALPVVAQVLVDVHRRLTGDLPRAVEGVLAPLELALDRDERAGDSSPIEVGDGAGKVRQTVALVVEGARKPAALVVDQDKGHLVRRIVHAQRENVGDDELRLARAGGARDQAVRPVHVLLEVEDRELAGSVAPHRRLQRARGVVLGPALANVELREVADLEHLEKAEGGGHLRALGGHVEARAGKVEGKGAGELARGG